MTPVRFVSVDRLHASLAPLRGEHSNSESTLAPMPLRVAELSEGGFEIIDGFKRLVLWKSEGKTEIPVVVESVSGVAMKARLLTANGPQKTAGPMDEARVVASLVDDDAMTPLAVAKLLGRKKAWVKRRLTLARGLAADLGRWLDVGTLSLTVASQLCAFDARTQMQLANAANRHALTSRQAEAFIVTYQSAKDSITREALLRRREVRQ